MSRYGGREAVPLDCKVYVGELGNNGSRQELEEAFGYYGPLKEVWVARNPPGFAFVMFQDPRDARDAVRGMDGKMVCGRRVRVELSNGKSRHEKSRYGGPPPRGEPYGRSGRDSPPYRNSRRAEPYGDSGRGSRGSDRNPRRRYSRSRSRSASPIMAGRARPRTPPSRSRSPIPKSPRQESRYRYGDR